MSDPADKPPLRLVTGADPFAPLYQAAAAAEEVGAAPPPPEPPDDRAAWIGNGGPFEGEWLPENFPVTPLGVQGKVCWFLDERRQLIDYAQEKVGRANIEGLLGTKPYLLERYWPRLKNMAKKDEAPEWVVTGFKPEDAGRSLRAACAVRGVWSPEERLRGAGTWLGRDGELIIHYGDEIAVYGNAGAAEWHEPAEIDGLVYPALPPLARPALQAQRGSGVGAELLAELETWNWARASVDPYLFLGHTVAGVLGGALAWRPLAWVPGAKNTGKSTLMKWRKRMLSAWLVSTDNATGPGIWQKLRWDSRPVDIDEAEASEGSDGNRRMVQLLELARSAASGGVILRGGQDHQSHEFIARSVFLFSSIGMPPLNSADRSRMAVLQLLALEDGATEPDISERRMEALGRRLLRRIVDQWQHFAPTLAAYRGALRAAGHTSRGADVFGPLLACQHLVLHDKPPNQEMLEGWAKALAPGGLAEFAGDMTIQEECLLHLLTQKLDNVTRTERRSIGDWVEIAASRDMMGAPGVAAQAALELLKSVGLTVRDAPADRTSRQPQWAGRFLWVAYRNVELARLFAGSKWQSSTQSVGGWIQHLAWLEGARPNVSFHCGAQTKALLIPLEHCIQGLKSSVAAPHAPSHAVRSATDTDPYSSDPDPLSL